LREPSLDAAGNRRIGIELKLPMSIGVDSVVFEDDSDTGDLQHLSSATITPNIEFHIPVSERWALRPFAALGWGSLFNGSESAWTYWAGIKSRFLLRQGHVTVSLINAVGFVGYSPSNGRSQDFWPLSIGVEIDQPLGKLQLGGEQAILNWSAMYTSFEEDLDLLTPPDMASQPITDQWELGLAISRQNGRIDIGWFSFNRLGLGYRFSSDGKLTGVNFIMRSLFDL
jgi:hypothetical protein